MTNPIKEIYRFQKEAGLLDRGYDDFLESSFQIEEALEGFSNLQSLADIFQCSTKPKDLSRAIIRKAIGDHDTELSDVDRLDKHLDGIVYHIGSLAKLGLSPQQIQLALLIVNQANLAKVGCPRDEHGKLLKPDNWEEKYAPEPKLAELLAKRGQS
jgi:predicted HAD superfamily Cof-like phosphohydrolase